MSTRGGWDPTVIVRVLEAPEEGGENILPCSSLQCYYIYTMVMPILHRVSSSVLEYIIHV